MDEIKPDAAGEGAQHQPALVERAASDADLAALEVLDAANGGIAGDHDGAERGCVGRELQAAAKGALARNKHDIGEDHIRGAADQRDLARLGRGQFRHDQVKAGFFREAMGLDDVELPRERAGFLRRDAQALRRAQRAGLRQGDEHRHSQPA